MNVPVYDPEEQIDIIDGTGRVLSSTTKVLAHREGLLHATVIGQLINGKGEFCFVQQSGDRQDAGQFVSPVGGHVRAGESWEAALIREAEEEVGITPRKYKMVGKTIYNRDVLGRHENHFFVCYEIYSDETPTLNHESVGFRRFSVDEIKKALRENPDLFGAAWHHLFKNLYPQIYNTLQG